MKQKSKFDYYIFVDYSDNLIGYNIIEEAKIYRVLPKISKLKHYKTVKHKKEYLSAVKRIIENQKVNDFFLKTKIKEVRKNIEIFADVAEFLKTHANCIVFVSIDNNQYASFCRLVSIIDGKNTKIVKESNLKKDSIEHKLSLVIDSLLNLQRTRKSK